MKVEPLLKHFFKEDPFNAKSKETKHKTESKEICV